MEKSLVSSRWLNIFLLFWFRCHQLCIICVIYMRRKKDRKEMLIRFLINIVNCCIKYQLLCCVAKRYAYDAVQESFLKYLNTKKDFNDVKP